MSSRALRRLEKNKLAELEFKSSTPESENVDDEQLSEEEVVQQRFNAFSLLNDNESDQAESEEEEQIETIKEPTRIVKETTPGSRKSKKKKKNAKQKKDDVKPEIDSDEELDLILAKAKRMDKEKTQESSNSPYDEDYDDDYDYDFEEEYDDHVDPRDRIDSAFKYFTTARLKQSLPLLSVKSIGNLDQDQEYRSLFGNLSMDLIEDANSTTSLAISPEMLQQFKRLARLTRGWGGKDRRSVPGTARKLLLSKIRDDYLPTTLKSLTMEEIKPNEYCQYIHYKTTDLDLRDIETKVKKEHALGVRYFKFSQANSGKEIAANTKFYAFTMLIPDHEGLMKILQENPYHVLTLLQVAMVQLRDGNNKSASSALIEKALFAFDRSFHKNFHELLLQAKTGLIRLPYERLFNRQFYLCLFRYIIALGERSTYFTALSYCKFLLSLSPTEDPLGVRYFIDYYAIMSQEYQYLINLSQSPLVTTYSQWLTPGIAFSTVLAHLRLGNKQDAKTALKKAFEAHPYTAYRLYEMAGRFDPFPFKDAFKLNRDDLVSTETYMVRAEALWNNQVEKDFLHDELKAFFASRKQPTKVEGIKASLFEFLGLSSPSEEPDSEDIPINLVRFTVLSGENRIMAQIPEKFWSRDDIYEYDVLAPVQSSIEGNLNAATICDSLQQYVDQNALANLVMEGSQMDNLRQNLQQIMQDDNFDEDDDGDEHDYDETEG